MENKKCLQPETGKLIHAYELNTLPEKDIERFETHLLKCTYCFEQVQKFALSAELLLSDDSGKREVESFLRESNLEKPSAFGTFWRYIWPDAPLIFRPAFAMILVLILIYPAYKGIFDRPPSTAGSAKMIHLLPERSIKAETFSIPADQEIVVSFMYYEYQENKEYSVELIGENNKLIFRDQSFRNFDDYGMAAIVLPASIIRPGSYELIINDTDSTAAIRLQIYRFILK
jgi:hypothetical protein